MSSFVRTYQPLLKPRPPGLTRLQKKQARDDVQREIRAQVFVLDPVCVICEKRPTRDPHHVGLKSRNPGKADQLENEIGTCRICHDGIHVTGKLKVTGSRRALRIWEWNESLGRRVPRPLKRLPMRLAA
jgi:hypothetical protein